jgi:hypothetical protein
LAASHVAATAADRARADLSRRGPILSARPTSPAVGAGDPYDRSVVKQIVRSELM